MATAFKNAIKASVTSVTTVYTAPAATTAVVVGLIVNNRSGSDTTITVDVIDSSASVTSNLRTSAPLPAASADAVLDYNSRVVLETGDSIRLTAANACDVVCAVMELS